MVGVGVHSTQVSAFKIICLIEVENTRNEEEEGIGVDTQCTKKGMITSTGCWKKLIARARKKKVPKRVGISKMTV